MLRIHTYGEAVLRRKAKPVVSFDDELRRLAADMCETMGAAEGVGLAAPQVGQSVRCVVIDASGGEGPPLVLLNPEIVEFSHETEELEEGCLSIPEIRLTVARPVRVSVKASDLNGAECRLEDAEGIFSRALQHEIDHLDGVLFVDRVSPLQRELVSSKLKKLAKGSRAATPSA